MKLQTAPGFRGTLAFVCAALFAVVLLVAIGGAGPRANAAVAELQAWTSGPQPDFTLQNTEGANVSLASQRGPIVLVHFFATWCEPCREELPALRRLVERGHSDVKVVAISVAEVDLRVRRFIETTPVNFPILLDRERIVAKAWNVSTLPTTFVLDGDLQTKLVVESDFAWDSIEPERMKQLLAARTHSSIAQWKTQKADKGE